MTEGCCQEPVEDVNIRNHCGTATYHPRHFAGYSVRRNEITRRADEVLEGKDRTKQLCTAFLVRRTCPDAGEAEDLGGASRDSPDRFDGELRTGGNGNTSTSRSPGGPPAMLCPVHFDQHHARGRLPPSC